MKKCIILSKYNIKNRKTKLFSGILLTAITMFLMTLTLSRGFVVICNSYKTDDIKLREIEAWPSNDVQFDNSVSDKVSRVKHIIYASQYINASFENNYLIEIDGVSLNCISEMRGINRRFSFAPLSTIYEKCGTENMNPILGGRSFKSEDTHKALIDENTCYILGYNELDDVIGKRITIRLNDVSIENIEIVGIFLSEFGSYGCELNHIDEDTKEVYLDSELCHPFLFSDDVILEASRSKDNILCDYENLCLLADNTDNVKKISDEIYDVFQYDSSNSVVVIERKAENVNSICVFLYMISAIILMSSFVVASNALIIRINNQKRYVEMMIKIGFQRKDILLIYIIEYTTIAMKSVAIASVVSFVGSLVVDIPLSFVYSEISSMSRFVFLLQITDVIVVIISVALFIVALTFVASGIQLNRIRKEMYR